jgi:hypothetical protein
MRKGFSLDAVLPGVRTKIGMPHSYPSTPGMANGWFTALGSAYSPTPGWAREALQGLALFLGLLILIATLVFMNNTSPLPSPTMSENLSASEEETPMELR